VEVAHAKLNLTLAVTGRRPDGFHELLSLVVDLELADELSFVPGGDWALSSNEQSMPCDETNLVIKAAKAFQRHYPQVKTGKFHLEKKVPMGAGLGGGSADAAAALRCLNRAEGQPFTPVILETIAAEVGSDCPYFIQGGKQCMRGRGEILEPLPATAAKALSGRRVFLIKPPFGVATPEAYAALAKSQHYQAPAEAEAALQAWIHSPITDPSILGNDLSQPVFRKHLALVTALACLEEQQGLTFRMTGSGSVCFALVGPEVPLAPVQSCLKSCWGVGAWVRETRILS
jgi:4-diphosphocytidyl-2-C-methyl-D-erythritol kinase